MAADAACDVCIVHVEVVMPQSIARHLFLYYNIKILIKDRSHIDGSTELNEDPTNTFFRVIHVKRPEYIKLD